MPGWNSRAAPDGPRDFPRSSIDRLPIGQRSRFPCASGRTFASRDFSQSDHAAPPEAVEAVAREDERVGATLLEALQARVDVAGDRDRHEIGPEPEKLRHPSGRRRGDARPGAERASPRGHAGVTRCDDERVARVRTRRHGGENDAAAATSVGTSCREWTAKSISFPRGRASSSARTKTPASSPPGGALPSLESWSPCVRTTIVRRGGPREGPARPRRRRTARAPARRPRAHLKRARGGGGRHFGRSSRRKRARTAAARSRRSEPSLPSGPRSDRGGCGPTSVSVRRSTAALAEGSSGASLPECFLSSTRRMLSSFSLRPRTTSPCRSPPHHCSKSPDALLDDLLGARHLARARPRVHVRHLLERVEIVAVDVGEVTDLGLDVARHGAGRERGEGRGAACRGEPCAEPLR